MALQAGTVLDVDPLTAALRALVERQEVTEDDIDGLRRTLYRLAPLEPEQAAQVLDAHRHMPDAATLWIEFFVEALADYFLTRQGNEIVLAAREEDLLLDAAGERAPIVDAGHRRLLLRLLLRATRVSERYQRLVFDMVRHHLAHDRRRLLIDLPREPGTVDLVDLQLIRKLIFGAGGHDAEKVARAPVALLLEIDRTIAAITDPDAFGHLLERVLPLHLALGPGDGPAVEAGVDQDAADWLKAQVEAGRTGPRSTSLIASLTERPMTSPDLWT
jgi:hypothetical protein